jgi:hypothetical protein
MAPPEPLGWDPEAFNTKVVNIEGREVVFKRDANGNWAQPRDIDHDENRPGFLRWYQVIGIMALCSFIAYFLLYM